MHIGIKYKLISSIMVQKRREAEITANRVSKGSEDRDLVKAKKLKKMPVCFQIHPPGYIESNGR